MRAIEASTISRELSAETTMPARIWPSSIRLAISTMPFKTPRHAFETSKTSASPRTPMASAMAHAVAGSRSSRQTPA